MLDLSQLPPARLTSTPAPAACPEPGSFRDRKGRVFYAPAGVCRGLSDEALRHWRRPAATVPAVLPTLARPPAQPVHPPGPLRRGPRLRVGD
ncbi:MAG TPA: hypothetical protein VFA26_02105 [Gemmataceae bacterium]|nr:hypothetical protein [Gemmataceae bacterium]